MHFFKATSISGSPVHVRYWHEKSHQQEKSYQREHIPTGAAIPTGEAIPTEDAILAYINSWNDKSCLADNIVPD